MSKRTRSKIILIALAGVLLLLIPNLAQAQGKGVRKAVHDETGLLSFLGADPRAPIAVPGAMRGGMDIPARALAILQVYGPDFGVANAHQELRLSRQGTPRPGRAALRYQQLYQGIPVLGGQLALSMTEQGELIALSGEISPGLNIPTSPQVDAQSAQQQALLAVARAHEIDAANLSPTAAELWVYDERLLLPSTRPAELVWRLEVHAQNGALVNELVLVNALTGGVSLHFNQIDTAWRSGGQLTVHPSARAAQPARPPMFGPPAAPPAVPGVPLYATYDANGGATLPGTLLCDQSQPACTAGSDLDADKAHEYALDTYEYFYNEHARDSLNNAGMTLISSVHYDPDPLHGGWNNAGWTGGQMVYGDGFGFARADDVVGHEFGHGVTQFTSNLFYYYQSGAINESFSDVWGEFVDQTNAAGDDSPGVKWLVGEDITGLGAIRSMANPPAYNDPDKMSSAFYALSAADNGGVHYNSGINNKAAYLMVEGGTFNGVTVTALGLTKTGAIYYEATSSLLVSGSDYKDLAFALYQACLNLVGGPAGILAADCTQVQHAIDAVEMALEPTPGYNPEAEVCAAGQVPSNIFYDDLESGDANWTYAALKGTSSWQWTAGYSTSGSLLLFGYDGNTSSDSYAAFTSPVAIPASGTPYLHFNHAFGFDDDAQGNWDGGVLEYSAAGGAWTDAAALYDSGLDYNGTIKFSIPNNLRNRPGFVADSHGYVSTRYDLTALAGQSVNFRWRLGTDSMIRDLGWVLDDVRIYTCVAASSELLANLSFEESVPSGWVGKLIAPVVDTSDCTVARTGSCSYKMAGDGDSSVLISYFPLSGLAGENVSLSVWNQTENAGGAGSALLRLVLIYTDETKEILTVPFNQGTHAWEQAVVNLIAAKDYRMITTSLIYTLSQGDIWWDDASLTINAGANLFDAKGSSFEAAVPAGWTGKLIAPAVDTVDCTVARSGSCSYTMTGDGDSSVIISYVPRTGAAGESLDLSVWHQTDNAGGTGSALLRLVIIYTDETKDILTVPFNQGTHGWEQATINAVAAKPYRMVTVSLIYTLTLGDIWWDDISLLLTP